MNKFWSRRNWALGTIALAAIAHGLMIRAGWLSGNVLFDGLIILLIAAIFWFSRKNQ